MPHWCNGEHRNDGNNEQQSIGLKRQAWPSRSTFVWFFHSNVECTQRSRHKFIAACRLTIWLRVRHPLERRNCIAMALAAFVNLLCIQWPPLIVAAFHSIALDCHRPAECIDFMETKKAKIDIHSVRIDFRLKSNGIFNWVLNNR